MVAEGDEWDAHMGLEQLVKTLEVGDMFVKGSEAYLLRGSFAHQPCLVKERRPKRYRHPQLDQELRFTRLRLEVRILRMVLREGLPVPRVLAVDPTRYRLVLGHVEGHPLGQLVRENRISPEHVQTVLAEVGQVCARLHSLGIIHGDLTPFNVLVQDGSQHRICLIDFGLASFSDEAGPKIMDLFTMEGALRAFSPTDCEQQFDAFLEGYEEVSGSGTVTREAVNLLGQQGRYKSHQRQRMGGSGGHHGNNNVNDSNSYGNG